MLWSGLTDLPSYRVSRAGAYLDERGLAAVFNADGWFLVLGLLGGLVLGGLLSAPSAGHGWRFVVSVLVLSCLASVLAYAVGRGLGPPPLGPRLHTASIGDRVVVPLRVQATGVYLSWPIGAMSGVLAAVLIRRRGRPAGPPAGEADIISNL